MDNNTNKLQSKKSASKNSKGKDKNKFKLIWFSTINRQLNKKDKKKDNLWSSKNVKSNNNWDKNNIFANYKNNKKKKKKANTIKFWIIGINFKLKKIMFIDNITIILLRNRKSFKVFIRTKQWKLKPKNKNKDMKTKKGNMKPFKSV